jgi:hypothetical protein
MTRLELSVLEVGAQSVWGLSLGKARLKVKVEGEDEGEGEAMSD